MCALQFHAVALLHALRASDRLAISKLVSTLTKANVRSPMAQCLLVGGGLPRGVGVQMLLRGPGWEAGAGAPWAALLKAALGRFQGAQ